MWASNVCRFAESVRGRLAERVSPQLSEVDIEDFDNEVYSYEVEARNDEDAALKAEELFNGDIYTMYIYLM